MDYARNKFQISVITPEEIERPKKSHKIFWDSTPFQGAVSRLQIDPTNQRAIAFVEKANNDIQAHKSAENYNLGRGKFPLKYLQDKYKSTQALRKTHNEKTAPEEKKEELAAVFETHCIATQEFCEEHGFPQTWAWQYADITKEPPWLSEAEGSQSSSDTANDSDMGTENTGGATNEASNEFGNISVTTADAGNSAGTGPSAQSGSGSGSGFDTEMGGVTDTLDKLTLDGEPIFSKRKGFKRFQFLVEESSGLHVWKSAQLCGDLNPEDIHSVEKPSIGFIAQHKHRYKGIRWIAMSVDDAITLGAGQYPRIAVMVEWLGDLEDTLLSRSDLNCIAGQARVDRDLQNHLPYRKMIAFEGRQVFIMSQTEAGLLNGGMKAMQRIKNDQFKAAKANQVSFGQTSLPQPGIAQVGAFQPDVAQPGIPQAATIQAAVPQVGATTQPDCIKPAQLANPQPVVAQPAVGQSAMPQAAIPQQAAPQAGLAQSIPADMIPSSVVQAMITNAVHQAIQQFQRQSAPAVAA